MILIRSERSAELGVKSGYEVVSEVDLDFRVDEEASEQWGVPVLKVSSGFCTYGIVRVGSKKKVNCAATLLNRS